MTPVVIHHWLWLCRCPLKSFKPSNLAQTSSLVRFSMKQDCKGTEPNPTYQQSFSFNDFCRCQLRLQCYKNVCHVPSASLICLCLSQPAVTRSVTQRNKPHLYGFAFSLFVYPNGAFSDLEVNYSEAASQFFRVVFICQLSIDMIFTCHILKAISILLRHSVV